MQNKNCKAYLDGIRDLRARIKREGGKGVASNLKEFRRMWLNLMRERDLMRAWLAYGSDANGSDLSSDLKRIVFEFYAQKYAKIASDFKERGLIESY